MNHFNTKKTWPGFPQQTHSRADGICFHLASIKIEEAHEQHAATVFHLANQLPAGAIHDFTVDNDAFNLYCFVCGHIVDGIKMCFVFVAQRQMQHQIELIGNAQPDEFFLLPSCCR